MLEPIAAEVTLIHRRDKFRAHEHSVENLMNSKVKIITPTEISALHGEEFIEKVTLSNVKTKETQDIEVDSVIVNFGFVSSLGPITEWGIDIEGSSIVVDSRMETNIPGLLPPAILPPIPAS